VTGKAKRLERDRRILEMRRSGLTFETIGQITDLSREGVRRVWERDRCNLLGNSPDRVTPPPDRVDLIRLSGAYGMAVLSAVSNVAER
jgi:hypothetical protein